MDPTTPFLTNARRCAPRRVTLLALLAWLATAAAGTASATDGGVTLPPLAATPLSIDVPAPDELAGKVVLLDFWATWCKPCLAAIPHLQSMAHTHADSPFHLVSVSTDIREETVRAFLAERDLSWPQLWDGDSALVTQLGVLGYPTYLLFDHQGQEIFRISGWAPQIAEILDTKVAAAVEAAQ
jgi:thiol-disulfide isomerase/thioredoxin